MRADIQLRTQLLLARHVLLFLADIFLCGGRSWLWVALWACCVVCFGLLQHVHGRKVQACGSAAGEPHVVPACTSMPLSGGDHDDVLPGAGRGPTSVGRDSGENGGIAEVQRAWWRANECYAMLGHSKPGPDGPNIR